MEDYINNIDYYCAWILTNTGYFSFQAMATNCLLNKSKISRKIDSNTKILNIKNFDLSFFSDTRYITCKPSKILNFILIKNPKEIPLIADIQITYNQINDSYAGVVTIYYQLDRDDNKNVLVKCEFYLKQNGKLKIYNIGILKEKLTNEVDENSIAHYIYILIKFIVHGDSHHHQKVDTITFVQKNDFDCLKILDDFIEYIKKIEFSEKKLSNTPSSSSLRILTLEDEINGIISYIKSFKNLFCNDKNELEKKLNIINNLKDSIVYKLNIKKIKIDFMHKTSTYFLTIIGIMYSSLLISYKLSPIPIKFNSLGYSLFILIFIILNFFILKQLIFNRIIAFLISSSTARYFIYEYLEFLASLPRKSLSSIPFKQRLIRFLWIKKLALLYIFYSFVPLLVFFCFQQDKHKLNNSEKIYSIGQNYFFTPISPSLFDKNMTNDSEQNQSKTNMKKDNLKINSTKKENIEYKKMFKINQFTLHYDKSFIDISQLSKNNIYVNIQKDQILKINSFLENLTLDNNYFIKITSHASKEYVVRKNTFSDNYQISQARAQSSKNFIIKKLLSRNFPINKLTFQLTYRSNYDALLTNHDKSRVTDIEFYYIK